MKRTVYISGPISDPATGQPREGWQKDFLEAEARLRAMGFYVINPVDIAQEVDDAFKWRGNFITGPSAWDGKPIQPTRADYIMACLQRIQMNYAYGCLHGVYVIGGHQQCKDSYGVRMEVILASLLGVPVYSDFLGNRINSKFVEIDGNIQDLLTED